MKKLFTSMFIFCVFSYSSLFAAATNQAGPFAGCFSRMLYDFDSTKFSFKLRKIRAAKSVLDPIKNELTIFDRETTNYCDNLYKKAKIAMVLSLFGGPIAIGTTVLSSAIGGGYLEREYLKERKLARSVIKNKLKKLEQSLSSGSIFDLETSYLERKKSFSKEQQKVIEDFFIAFYDQGLNVALVVTDLLDFPYGRFICLSDPNNPEKFRQNLARDLEVIKDIPEISKSQGRQIYTKIRRAELNATKQLPGSRTAIYFQKKQESVDGSYIDNINALAWFLSDEGKSFAAMDAADHPILNKKLIYGSKGSQKGFLTEAFLVTKKTNMTLVIYNFDKWTEDESNTAYLLELLDPDKKTLPSDYFGFDIDVSGLNIFCSGTADWNGFDPAIKSRLVPFYF